MLDTGVKYTYEENGQTVLPRPIILGEYIVVEINVDIVRSGRNILKIT